MKVQPLPRSQPKIATEQSDQFFALDHNTHLHVLLKTRSTEQIERLIAALAAFNDGKLGPVVRVDEGDELHARCNLRVAQMHISVETATFLGKCGVRFAGEACYLVFDRRKPGLAAMEKAVRRELRLPEDDSFDPLAHGWRPPYWDDTAFRHAIDMPTIEVFGTYLGGMHYNWRRSYGDPRNKTLARHLRHRDPLAVYMGDTYKLLRPNWNVGSMRSLQTLLTVHARKTKLWAGALVPPSWQPAGIPESWVAEDATIAAEFKEYLKPAAYVVEWNDTTASLLPVRKYNGHGHGRSREWQIVNSRNSTANDGHGNIVVVDEDPVTITVDGTQRNAQAFRSEEDARSFIDRKNPSIAIYL